MTSQTIILEWRVVVSMWTRPEVLGYRPIDVVLSTRSVSSGIRYVASQMIGVVVTPVRSCSR